jgi:hypothetical protein
LQPNSLPTVSLKSEFDIHASYYFTRASCPPLRLGSLRASRRWTSSSLLCFGSSYSLQSKQLQSSAARLCPSLARLRCGRWAAKRGPTAFGIAAWTNQLEDLLPLLSNFPFPTSNFGPAASCQNPSDAIQAPRPSTWAIVLIALPSVRSSYSALQRESSTAAPLMLAPVVSADTTPTSQPNHEHRLSQWLRLGNDHSNPQSKLAAKTLHHKSLQATQLIRTV